MKSRETEKMNMRGQLGAGHPILIVRIREQSTAHEN